LESLLWKMEYLFSDNLRPKFRIIADFHYTRVLNVPNLSGFLAFLNFQLNDFQNFHDLDIFTHFQNCDLF
jgi:hypothetical protein